MKKLLLSLSLSVLTTASVNAEVVDGPSVELTTLDQTTVYVCPTTNFYTEIWNALENGRSIEEDVLKEYCPCVLADEAEQASTSKTLDFRKTCESLKKNKYTVGPIAQNRASLARVYPTSVIYRCFNTDCFPVQTSESAPSQNYEPRIQISEWVLKNIPTSSILRRPLLSPSPWSRYKSDIIDWAELSKTVTVESVQQATRFSAEHNMQRLPVETPLSFAEVIELLQQKEVLPTEQLFPTSLASDFWLDETVLHPSLSLTSARLNTSSAAWLAFLSDPGDSGILLILDDKTALYYDSERNLHSFPGWLNQGKPVLLLDKDSKEQWVSLPGAERAFPEELKTVLPEILQQYLTKSSTSSEASYLTKLQFKTIREQQKLLSSEEQHLLISRPRGGDIRQSSAKELLPALIGAAIMDPITLHNYRKSCLNNDCNVESALTHFRHSKMFAESTSMNLYSTAFSWSSRTSLSTPAEAVLTNEITCTSGTALSAAMEVLDMMFRKDESSRQLTCAQGSTVTLDAPPAYHSWCWDKSEAQIFENGFKLDTQYGPTRSTHTQFGTRDNVQIQSVFQITEDKTLDFQLCTDTNCESQNLDVPEKKTVIPAFTDLLLNRVSY